MSTLHYDNMAMEGTLCRLKRTEKISRTSAMPTYCRVHIVNRWVAAGIDSQVAMVLTEYADLSHYSVKHNLSVFIRVTSALVRGEKKIFWQFE